MKYKVRIGATIFASALTLTACGGTTAGEGSDNVNEGAQTNAEAGELRTVRLAAVPVVDVAALYLGSEIGVFEEHGLELDIQFTPGSSVAIPAMLNDDFDVVYTGSVNAFQARETGLPVVAIAEGGRTTGEPGADHGGILVHPDSDINDPSDLEGKEVAVNAILGLHEAADRQSVINDGGDPNNVNFLELDLPEMLPALENGNVDAISTSEPFLGLGIDAGMKLIADPFIDVDEDFITAVYLTSEQNLSEQEELIEDFTSAVKESQEYATENPDEFRSELTNFTDIEPEVAEDMILTKFGWGFPQEALRSGAEASQETGIISDIDKALDGLVLEENN